MLRSLLGGAVVLAGTLAAVGVLPADAEPAPTGPPGISPDTQFKLVAGSVLTSPVPVKASDGKVQKQVAPLDRDIVTFSSLPRHPTSVP